MNRDGTEYEKPVAKIIEFNLEDSIASSADHGPDLSCSETTWGMGEE